MPYGYVILSLIGEVMPISEMCHIQREASALLVLQEMGNAKATECVNEQKAWLSCFFIFNLVILGLWL